MKFMTALKKFIKARFFVGLFFVGLIFIIGGIAMKLAGSTPKETATATITEISEQYDASTESYTYPTTITYTASDGNTYTATLSGSSDWKKNDTIEIQYDVDNPENVSYGDFTIIPYVALGVGIVAVGVAVVKFILIMKTPADKMNDFNHVNMDNVNKDEVEALKNSTEPQNHYYFHYTTGINQNYIMKTDNSEVVYEALNQKLSILTSYEYKFVDHKTGKEETKTCSHTVSTEYGSGNIGVETDASFKINGELCWDVLGKTGYSIEPHLQDLHMTFDVLKYGVKVAHMEHAGTNIITGKDYTLGNVPAPGIYSIQCRDSDIPGIFLCCFIISRTYDYNH